MYKIKRIRIFESTENVIDEINSELKENLDEFESIAGGECHDVALIAFHYAKESGFLSSPKIKWTGGHSWVEGEYDGVPVIFDIVAINQKHLGEPFSIKNVDANEPEGIPTANSKEEYIDQNIQCGISIESAEYGAEELEFLNKFII